MGCSPIGCAVDGMTIAPTATLRPGPQFPDSDRWFQSIDLSLQMPMLATQLCLPLMEAGGGGAVVNVASSGGLEPGG